MRRRWARCTQSNRYRAKRAALTTFMAYHSHAARAVTQIAAIAMRLPVRCDVGLQQNRCLRAPAGDRAIATFRKRVAVKVDQGSTHAIAKRARVNSRRDRFLTGAARIGADARLGRPPLFTGARINAGARIPSRTHSRGNPFPRSSNNQPALFATSTIHAPYSHPIFAGAGVPLLSYLLAVTTHPSPIEKHRSTISPKISTNND